VLDRGSPAEMRTLGRTGLTVTPISVGCAALGGLEPYFGYDVPTETALDTVRAAFRGPFNLLDTAPLYGDSEERIGRVIRELGGIPPGYVLTTKADRDPATNDFSGNQVRMSVRRSLERLGLEQLPLIFLHDPEYGSFDQITGVDGAIEALLELRDEGVVEHLGIAGGPIDLMIQFMDMGIFDVVITHNRFTLVDRSALPLIDLAAEREVAVVNAAPYGSGILAKGADAHPLYRYEQASPETLRRVRHAEMLARYYNVPLAAVALQHSLNEPGITTTIVGMSRPERIEETRRLATLPIPVELWQKLELPDRRLN
jgi:D-threo-aldose 1-dehydrogenase